jgi:CO/xanthine dehydrogenase FAD-binding subunit
MRQLKAYHRPDTVEAALRLLARPATRTAILGGGTSLIANLPEDIDEIVDLQAVGLAQVEHGKNRLTLGAMVRLQTIVDDEKAPSLLSQMAQREGPNTFRNVATVGGAVVGAGAESELLAALLVFEAAVTVQTLDGERSIPLQDFLADVQGTLADGLVTAVSLRTSGRTAHARVARTPQDQPIVAAVARKDESRVMRLALCGVAQTVVLVDSDDLESLNPPGDFRGSSEYRLEMAKTLSQRVLRELEIQV